MVAPMVANPIGSQESRQTRVLTVLSFKVNRLRLRNVGYRKSAFTHPSQIVDLFHVQKERLIPIANDGTRARCNCQNCSTRPFDLAASIVEFMIAYSSTDPETSSERSTKDGVRPRRNDGGFPSQRPAGLSVLG